LRLGSKLAAGVDHGAAADAGALGDGGQRRVRRASAEGSCGRSQSGLL